MTHLDVKFGVEVLHNGLSDECFGTVLHLHLYDKLAFRIGFCLLGDVTIRTICAWLRFNNWLLLSTNSSSFEMFTFT